MNKASWLWLFLISSVLLCSGCVERALVIRSEPAGARVFIDGIDSGTTPIRVPFDFYGTRDVLVRMEEDEKESKMDFWKFVTLC